MPDPKSDLQPGPRKTAAMSTICHGWLSSCARKLRSILAEIPAVADLLRLIVPLFAIAGAVVSCGYSPAGSNQLSEDSQISDGNRLSEGSQIPEGGISLSFDPFFEDSDLPDCVAFVEFINGQPVPEWALKSGACIDESGVQNVPDIQDCDDGDRMISTLHGFYFASEGIWQGSPEQPWDPEGDFLVEWRAALETCNDFSS